MALARKWPPTPRGPIRRFTQPEDVTIQRMAAASATATEIAIRLKRPMRAVLRHGNKQLNIRFKRIYAPEDIDLIRDLFRRNWTLPQIAEYLGQSVGSVRILCERKKISHRVPRKVARISIRICEPLLWQLVKATGTDSGIVIGRYVRDVVRRSVEGSAAGLQAP